MNRAARAAATLALLTLAGAAAAQPPPAPAPESAAVRGASAQTRKRLLEIEQKLTAGKHADAADDLQRVLDESGGDLIPPEVSQSHPAARRLAHQLLSRLSPDVLRTYRDRIDQPAKRLLAQAKEGRDPQPLYQLLDRYFVSRPAGEALLLLGDLLFERGEFRGAEAAWRQLLPDAGADLVYPDSTADPALVRARIVLAQAVGGALGPAKEALAAFKQKHPNATGTLAGRTGPLADTLQAVLDGKPQLAPEPPAESWATFGGGPDRAGRVPGGLPRDWGRASWSARLPAVPRREANNPPARQPFGHPVIANGEVFVADASRVYRFDLRTGKPRPYFSSEVKVKSDLPGYAVDACASLTAANGRLYARFGPPTVHAPEDLSKGELEESYLACLRPTADEIEPVWKLPPPEDRKVPAAWEGAPLAVGKRLWAVYAKFEGGRVVHVAVGYDPVGDRTPDRPAWATELCDSAQPVSGAGRTRQELLTLCGRNLVFCSNTGAVVAVDAATGQRVWAFRYPRSRKSNHAGDPSPAVAFGGRVLVAPADGERVYCLDGATGGVVWGSGPTEGARILGVARGRVIVTVTGPLAGLRGLNLDTGSHHREDGGWVQCGTLSYGQGVVTDDVILWPSRAGLYFVRPENGLPTPGRPNPLPPPLPTLARSENGLPAPGRPSPLPENRTFFGNLVYADGTLVVVTHAQVWGYRAESYKIVPRPDVPADLFHWLIDRSERDLAAGDTAACLTALTEAATGDFPPQLRAWAAARLVQLSPHAGELPTAVRRALPPALMSEWVLTADGLPVTLEAFVNGHLRRPTSAPSVPVTSAPAARYSPALAPQSEREHTWQAPSGLSPLLPIPGATEPPKRLFMAGGDRVLGVPLNQEAETEHAAAELFTHASDLRDGFVAVGPRAVALFGTARDPLWVFRAPVTPRLTPGPLPYQLRAGADALGPYLSSFRLAGSWLLARLGEFHLIALDLGARRVAWVLAATGDSGYEPVLFAATPRFGPHFATADRFAVVQLSDGQLWFVRLDTGRPETQPAARTGTALASWPHAPLEVSGGRLALADGAGRVRLVDLGGPNDLPPVALPLPGRGPLVVFAPGARTKWRFATERLEGLAGDPPQLRAFGAELFVAVRRNYGVDLEPVGTADGRPLWHEPAFLDADRVDLSGADADADRVYVPVGNKVVALAREDGAPVWAATVPDAGETGWVVRVGKSGLIAHPRRAPPREPVADVLARLARSFEREPYLWRLPGLAATLYDAWVDRAVPVVLLDPETGKRTGRFNIPARGPGLAVWLGPDATAIATGDRIVWLK
ncbi:PQQ-binding-like beta-propeller repeat protein [Gemmata sp. JC673]|uniref:PQQ-binding-like beta-propeller repeat protein n=1 Tax=Gemmata algarum TaxID=2975278 RepID=A0ABU5EWA4_9BACT|nr:PQQ-binding-like beta-propeller repeat protein [Gemmata algarum]MDY3559238.1 PQQ-binding-like beta-propeller repeat protein [Gemmata algarum]